MPGARHGARGAPVGAAPFLERPTVPRSRGLAAFDDAQRLSGEGILQRKIHVLLKAEITRELEALSHAIGGG